jgi:hypothetical protein
MKFTILTYLLLLPTLTIFGQNYKLYLNSPENSAFIYRISDALDVQLKSKDGTENSEERKIVDYQFTKSNKQLKGNAQHFGIKILDITAESVVNGDTSNYHFSEKVRTNASVARIYDSLIGQGFEAIFDNKGNFKVIDKANEFEPKDMGTADIFEEYHLKNIKDKLKFEFSGRTLQQTMRFFSYAYPKDSVAIGDTWTVFDTLYADFGVLATMNFTLKSVSNGIAMIEISSELGKIPNFKGVDKTDMFFKFSLKGQQEGFLLLDMKTGWIRKLNLSQSLSGLMTVFFLDPMGVDLKIQLKGSTEYNLINSH